ncbi:MAG TPA: polyprenyl synthetase family protein [Blastocatellia bacterium]|nr:polyprenyl synthetase family protein [Blastocatellia bacterium]
MQSRLYADPAPLEERLMTPDEIFSLVRDELLLVEEEFGRGISDAGPAVSSIGKYLRDGGGKRVRPALLLLSANLIHGRCGPSAIRMASVMEMLHSATLVHDDIIDDARVRRGRPSVNAKWGNDVTVLMGDWLYMTAFDMTLRERNFDLLDVLTSMTRLMTEGEIIQLAKIGNSRITEAEHMDIVRRKTAFMFSACSEVGAIVAGASEAEREALASYGLSVGIAFQLTDDLLDFVSTEDKLGKPVANDLREGKLTLPLIYLLEKDNQERRDVIETVMRESGFHSVGRDQVLEMLCEDGALDRARAAAHQHALQAADALAIFPPSQYRDALLSVPRFIVEREM